MLGEGGCVPASVCVCTCVRMCVYVSIKQVTLSGNAGCAETCCDAEAEENNSEMFSAVQSYRCWCLSKTKRNMIIWQLLQYNDIDNAVY